MYDHRARSAQRGSSLRRSRRAIKKLEAENLASDLSAKLGPASTLWRQQVCFPIPRRAADIPRPGGAESGPGPSR